jgi:hypothetical protein
MANKKLEAIPMNELMKRFTYHPPKGDQPRRYVAVRELAKEMALELDSLCPDSREKALAITKLEEVVFWANASIARNEEEN